MPVGESGLGVSDAVRNSILAGVSSPDTVVDTASKSVVAAIDLTALGVTVWLGGAVLFFMIQMIRYASMRDDLLSDATDITIIDGVSVVASDQVAGPLAFGLFKRFIAVPLDFTKAYSPAERELAIAHEMAHHKSGDLFANLAAFIVLCLMWFNPLAWASWSAFRFDQEAACDARVLTGKCAEDRVIYGQALARTAFDGVPTFATALNSPKTIIERLKRLTMKDASKQRRSVGKLGILAAAAVILPLTATIVPAINAHDETVAVAAAKPVIKKRVKIIRIDKKLSQDEVETMIERAQESREAADEAWTEAFEARIEADAARTEADVAGMSADAARAAADHARVAAEVGRREAIRVMSHTNFAFYIPEIDIREITKNCKQGQPVTTNVHGFDGQNKSTIKIVMCGKGQAKLARIEAQKGLRQALSELASDVHMSDVHMSEAVRKDLIEKFEKAIRKMEADANKPI